MELGEVEEFGASKNGAEVQATWNTSDNTRLVVVDGTALATYTTPSVSLSASYSGETATKNIAVVANTGIKFKVIEMNIGSSVTYNLEFVDNAQTIPNTDLNFLFAKGGIVSVNSSGTVTPIKEGEDIIFVIYKGKRYGHHVVVSDTMVLNSEVEIKEEEVKKPQKRTKKKSE